MTKNKLGRIIVIVGPTASGKSDLGIKIAKKFNGEVISADSRQVYCGMDIGTGKVLRDRTFPSLRPKALSFKPDFYFEGIRHHLIDVANPKKQFTANDFKRLGEEAIKKITALGKIPIIVGGTGFYIDVLLGRMQIAEVPPNKKLRAKLEKQSAEQLFKQLSTLDSQRSKIIDRHNKRRLIRAIEIIIENRKLRVEGNSKTTHHFPHSTFKVLWIGINPGKERLAKNIKKRLDKRLSQGTIREVKRLHKQGVSWKRLDDLGLEYRWVSRWLIQNLKIKIQNYADFIEHPRQSRDNSKFKNSEEYIYLLRDIVRYSKRQMTWFKRNKEIHWLKNPK